MAKCLAIFQINIHVPILYSIIVLRSLVTGKGVSQLIALQLLGLRRTVLRFKSKRIHCNDQALVRNTDSF